MKKLHGKRKYTLSLLTVFSLFIQLFVPFFSTSVNAVGSEEQVRDENGVILVNDNNTYENTEFHKDNLFGIAGGFHLVGLDTVDKKAHIHGNILANNFINDGDFGTRDKKEVSYLRNITGGTVSAGADKNSILVVGKDTTIGTVDNGNAWSINGNKVERPNKQDSPNGLWQDDEAEFIDFNKVKQQTDSLVNDLSGLENNATEIENSDQNKQEIIVSEDDEFSVYNIKNGDFNFTNPIHIKGFNKEKPSTLIINVDMSKMDNKNEFSIPESVAHYTNGDKVSTGEVNEWSNANVVWNVYDSSNEGNKFTGTIKNGGPVTGSIVSPGATVELNSNLNGTVIANDIIVNAESHRDDYVPPKPDPSVTSVSVEKVWKGEAQDSVTINLLADGEEVDSVKLSEDNNWKHTFSDLPAEGSDEKAIEYTIEEVAIDGYETNITGNATEGFVVTNTEEETPVEPATTSVSVEKVWKGEAQDSVTINLLAGGEEVDSVKLSEDNNWKHTFSDLPAEGSDEKAIEYTIEEVAIDGYETNITGNATEGFVVTNTEEETPVEPATTSVSVEKVWKGEAQDSVTINLLAGGEEVDSVKLSEDNNWKHTFSDLPAEGSDEKAIEYTIEEVAIDGYETNITGNATEGFVVTNTEEETPVEPATTSVSVEKVWKGEAQDSVTINLLAGGEEVDSVKLSEDNNWKHTFSDLPAEGSDEKAIEYTIEEVAIDGYETNITGNATEGFVVTNTEEETPVEPATTSVSVEKVWKGEAQDSVTINLLAGGEEVDSVKLSEDNNWKHTFSDLPAEGSDEKAIEYTIEEVAIDGYETNITGNATEGFVVTNTEEETPVEPATTSVSVEKVWKGEAQDSVTINLLAGGEEVDSVKLSEDNNWKHTFSDLPAEGSDEKAIEYTIEEVAIDGYETNITGNATEGFVVTNTEEETPVEPATTSVSVEKVWKGEAQDSVTINLLAGGEEVDSVKLSEDNNWKHTFSDLPAEGSDEKAIEYTIEEVAIDGYETNITGNATEGFVVTNTEEETPVEPATTSVSVEKVWKGEAQDSVTINLLAGGEEVDSVKLSEDNNWKHTFSDLPAEGSDEKAIEYTIEEVAIDGYETNITGNATEGFVVTNTKDTTPPKPEPDTTEVNVEKKWIGEAQDSVTVNLLADGKKVDSVKLSADNNWKHTFEDLDAQTEDLEEITYTVEEVKIDGYEISITGSAASGFVITNTKDTTPPDPEPEEPTDPEDPEPEESAEPEDKLPQTGEAINILAPFGIILIIMGLGTLISKRYIKE